MSDGTDDKDKKAKATLDDSSIVTSRGMNRRTILRGFGIGTLGLGGAAVSGCQVVEGTGGGLVGIGGTDIDNGNITDPGGQGRGALRGRFTGLTDRDNGNITDPGGQGRGQP